MRDRCKRFRFYYSLKGMEAAKKRADREKLWREFGEVKPNERRRKVRENVGGEDLRICA